MFCVFCEFLRPCDEMHAEERADDASAIAVIGRASMSSTAGEMLRVEEAVRNEDVVDAASVKLSVLEVFVLGL